PCRLVRKVKGLAGSVGVGRSRGEGHRPLLAPGLLHLPAELAGVAPPATFATAASPRGRPGSKRLAGKPRRGSGEAVARTLEGLRPRGLDPQGWELGQAVVRGAPCVIAAALGLPGVNLAVLDWELGGCWIR